MTLNEFKAWFEGFSEGIETVPTVKQFAKIKAKVAEINEMPVTRQYFLHNYPTWPHQNAPWWQNPVVSYSAGAAPMDHGVGRAVLAAPNGGDSFDAQAAMYAAGALDAVAA